MVVTRRPSGRILASVLLVLVLGGGAGAGAGELLTPGFPGLVVAGPGAVCRVLPGGEPGTPVSAYVTGHFWDHGRRLDVIAAPGRPLVGASAHTAGLPARLAAGVTELTGVPAFSWTYGCSPTSAGMLVGYYDRTGYPNLYTGPTNGGVCPLNNGSWGQTNWPSQTCGECPFVASHLGIEGRTTRGHVDDYWIDYKSTASDPYITGGWTQHVWDCLADFMGSNQSAWGNTDGSTIFVFAADGSPVYDCTSVESGGHIDGCHGVRAYIEYCGYPVAANYNQYIKGYNGCTQGFTFAQYEAEINAGRPVLIHVSGHTMIGFGYDASSQTIYVHDTWNYNDHTMTWGGSYEGEFPQYGVTVLCMVPSPAFSLSGTVRDGSGNPVGGVTLATRDAMTTSGNDGRYTLANLAGGSYTVTASRAEMAFASVKSQPVVVNHTAGSATGVDFVGTVDTYTVVGAVTNSAGGGGLSGVTVTAAAGGATTTATTGSDGSYTLTGLVAGTYSLTASLAEYTFLPASRTATVNQTVGGAKGKNFTGTVRTYSVAGYARDSKGAPLAGVQVSTGAQSAPTDSGGHYVIAGLVAGQYTVTPSLTEYGFSPTSLPVTVNQSLGDAHNQNFTGMVDTYTIAGTVTLGGQPAPGVRVSAGGKTATTGASGGYTLSGLVAGSYTVSASQAERSFVAVKAQPIAVSQALGSASGVDFTATVDTYSISGTVTVSGGGGLGGVAVSAGSQTTTTASDGSYTLSGLVAGSYIVTPTLAEYTFQPAHRTPRVSQAAGSAPGVNFVATARSYTISGYARDSHGAPLGGVQVTAGGQSTATDSTGHYQLGGLPAGSYTVTPTLAEHSFSPSSRPVTVNHTLGDAHNQNFTGTVLTYSIGGTITESGQPLAGVLVSAGGKTALTGAGGSYTLTGLVAGAYTVTPSRNETVFTPGSLGVTVNQTAGSASGQNFTAGPRLYTISGKITDPTGAALAGVTVTVRGQTTQTASDGTYSVGGLVAGSYTATPTLAERVFAPTSQAVTVNQTLGSASGVDFVGKVMTYSVAGYTRTGKGAALAGVEVTAGTASTVTDSSGHYVLSGLPAGGYPVTPTLAGYSFSPLNRAVTVNQSLGDAHNVNFTGTATAPVPAGALALSAAAEATARGATLTYTLSAPADVAAVVLNIAGRPVAEIPAEAQAAGVQSLRWNGRNQSGSLAPDGVYLIRLVARTPDGASAEAVVALDLRR